MKAVKVGKCFNLFSEQELSPINLEQTAAGIKVDGVTYPLHRGATFEDSQMVDGLLDCHGELPIRDYKVKSQERER